MSSKLHNGRFHASFYSKDLYQLYVEPIQAAKSELKKPSDIVRELDKYVIGQQEAKEILATTLINHDLITQYNKSEPETLIKKTSLLFVGPTGTGKTYMIETIGRIMNKHVVVIDITHYTQAGYVGKSVSDIIKEARIVSEGDLDNTIIFVDEFDKISTSINNSDVSGTAVQMELLKLVEGGENTTVYSKNDEPQPYDTRGILWVFGGAFTAFREEKEEEEDTDDSFGFTQASSKSEKGVRRLTHDDLIEAGIMRELIGRIGDVINLDVLDEASLRKILLESKDSPIKQYEILAKLRGIKLNIKDKDIDDIIKESMELGTGARGLKTIADRKFKKAFYK